MSYTAMHLLIVSDYRLTTAAADRYKMRSEGDHYVQELLKGYHSRLLAPAFKMEIINP